jgi:hypothetical protein
LPSLWLKLSTFDTPARRDIKPTHRGAKFELNLFRIAMLNRARPSITPSALALGAAVLWGVIEWVALWRSRWRERKAASPG